MDALILAGEILAGFDDFVKAMALITLPFSLIVAFFVIPKLKNCPLTISR